MSNKIASYCYSLINKSRDWYDAVELINIFQKTVTAMSWGAHNWVIIRSEKTDQPRVIQFKVQGHHHKGYVVLNVNGGDLVDIHLLSSHGNLKNKIENIFLEDLLNVIDEHVERIESYVR